MRTENLDAVVRRVMDVCQFTAPTTLLSDLRQRFRTSGLTVSVARHNTPMLFDWMARTLSFQGVSDTIAAAYLDQHGTVGFDDITALLITAPCSKLTSYWHFHDCRFAKAAFTCGATEHIARCPVPTHDLRNGRLNQATYSLFLFVRDICEGDLVAWLDAQLDAAAQANDADRARRLRNAVLDPLACVFGVSHKVLSMTLSDLLLAGDPDRTLWVEAGASMVVVDTLVHNWLHRSGCLGDLNAAHPYGPVCYSHGGCAEILESVAQAIDARQFCPEGPTKFPRLVQKAIWRFCAAGSFNICNGNHIDDRQSCTIVDCPVETCARITLRRTL